MSNLRLNLGSGPSPIAGYVNVDIVDPCDLKADLNLTWSWEDNSVDEVRAWDIFEHLTSPVHTMNEAWRVLRHGGILDIVVPTTDGRGAWQDPGHVSFWNRNSFFYFTEGNAHLFQFAPANGVRCAFRVAYEKETWDEDRVSKLHIRLTAVKCEPTVDVMFLAKNRLEYTKEALKALAANTNWKVVKEFVIYDDGSTDGTLEFLRGEALRLDATLRRRSHGLAILAFNDFVTQSKSDLVCKIDNDAMMPPNWLDVAVWMMKTHPELDVLGLEERGLKGELPFSYEPTPHIGGLFIARRSIFQDVRLPSPQSTYYGWQTWLEQNSIRCGWLKPSLPVFLLDRIPFEPWNSLGKEYEAKGWQRPWQHYTEAQKDLWEWWVRK